MRRIAGKRRSDRLSITPSDDTLAALIRTDDIDILIDPSAWFIGTTRHNLYETTVSGAPFDREDFVR